MTVNNTKQLDKERALIKNGYDRVKEQSGSIWKPHPSAPGLKILHVKARFLLPQVAGVPHIPGGPPPPCEQALSTYHTRE